MGVRLARATLLLATLIGVALGADLKTVKRVHVGSMGQSDEAARFRLILEAQLLKVGFEPQGTPESADATLTGVLIVRVFADGSTARATVVLKDKDGVRLWGGDFQPKMSLASLKRGYIWQKQDAVDYRAEDIARGLRKACGTAQRIK